LRQRSGEPFDACPYCLTEVTADAAQLVPSGKREETEQVCSKEEAEDLRAPPECKNHFGYLGERSLREQIPDECMMCKALLQCMLKKAIK
jgi:hypothetical protein